MALSIVIPTRNRDHLLEECLVRLLPTLRPEDELIVADSASSSDATRAMADKHGVGYVRCDEPGASRARNAGARAGRHPRIAFVDDDVRVRDGWVQAAESALDEVDYVVARISAPDGQDPDRPVALRDDTERREIPPGAEPRFEASACFAISRQSFEAVGGFDERLGPGCWFSAAEDLELFDRLRRAGAHGRFEPTMHVEHDQWRARKDLIKLEWSYGKGMGAYLSLVNRRSRRDAREQARTVLWSDGLSKIPSLIKVRFEFAVLCELLRFSATVLAFVTAGIGLRKTDGVSNEENR